MSGHSQHASLLDAPCDHKVEPHILQAKKDQTESSHRLAQIDHQKYILQGLGHDDTSFVLISPSVRKEWQRRELTYPRLWSFIRGRDVTGILIQS